MSPPLSKRDAHARLVRCDTSTDQPTATHRWRVASSSRGGGRAGALIDTIATAPTTPPRVALAYDDRAVDEACDAALCQSGVQSKRTSVGVKRRSKVRWTTEMTFRISSSTSAMTCRASLTCIRGASEGVHDRDTAHPVRREDCVMVSPSGGEWIGSSPVHQARRASKGFGTGASPPPLLRLTLPRATPQRAYERTHQGRDRSLGCRRRRCRLLLFFELRRLTSNRQRRLGPPFGHFGFGLLLPTLSTLRTLSTLVPIAPAKRASLARKLGACRCLCLSLSPPLSRLGNPRRLRLRPERCKRAVGKSRL